MTHSARFLFAIGGLLAILACPGAGGAPDLADWDRPERYVSQILCDSAINSAPAQPLAVERGEWRQVFQSRGDGLSNPIGVAWNPRGSMLAVLDWSLGSVVLYDTLGNEIRRIGRPGAGPSDFGLRGMMGGGNRIAWANDSVLIVADSKGLLSIAPPLWQPKPLWLADTFPGSFRGRVHLRVVDSRIFLGWTGHREASGTAPARGRVFELRWDDQAAPKLILDWWRAYPVPQMPDLPDKIIEPYRSAYQRSWDALGPSSIALLGKTAFGICVWNGSRITAAMRVSASTLEVDSQEKEALVNDFFGTRPPANEQERFERQSLFEGRFPPHGPWYTTLWATQDATNELALGRIGPGRSRWIDIVDPVAGRLIRTLPGTPSGGAIQDVSAGVFWTFDPDANPSPAIVGFSWTRSTPKQAGNDNH